MGKFSHSFSYHDAYLYVLVREQVHNNGLSAGLGSLLLGVIKEFTQRMGQRLVLQRFVYNKNRKVDAALNRSLVAFYTGHGFVPIALSSDPQESAFMVCDPTASNRVMVCCTRVSCPDLHVARVHGQYTPPADVVALPLPPTLRRPRWQYEEDDPPMEHRRSPPPPPRPAVPLVYAWMQEQIATASVSRQNQTMVHAQGTLLHHCLHPRSDMCI
jgi:hypothetical protein